MNFLKNYKYQAVVKKNRIIRAVKQSVNFNLAKAKVEPYLPYRIAKHQSLLVRKLGNSDIKLQKNKIINLYLAVPNVDGIVIRPGQTFSFWKLIGCPNKKQGYVEGMLLWNGEVKVGVGGGLCQLSNLIYWLALHSPLTVKERYRHEFDAFPDSGRTVPFGTGATVFYNYIDLQVYNPAKQTFQFHIYITDKHLKGEILSDKEWPVSYSIQERDAFFTFNDKEKTFHRNNKIFREIIDKQTGKKINEELISENSCLAKYTPDKENNIIKVN